MASASTIDGLASAGILDESSLRQLSRSAKTLLPTSSDDHKTQDDVVKYVNTFQLVVKTASSETLSATHQVAAWNTLSTFLDQTATQQSRSLRSLLWTARLWQKGLYTFLTRGPEARPKSIKQLLGSLTSALHKTQSDLESIRDRQDAARLLVATVLQKDDQWPVRPCLMLLSNLLRKGVFDLEQISEAAESNSRADCLGKLLQACMNWTVIDDCASTAGQLLSVLLDQAETVENVGPEQPLWVDTLSSVLEDRPETITAFRLYLMPTLFKRNKEGFLGLLHRFDINTHLQASKSLEFKHLTVLLAALQVGNASGLVEISPDTTLDASVCPVRLPVSTLVPLLRHADRSMRLNGLSLVIDTPSISHPLHKVALDALKVNLPHLHADTDLNFRSELFSLSQKLLDRLRASTANKVKVSHGSQSAGDELVQSERNFILWYKRFLMWELRPGASYQRHISALRCLAILMRSGVDRALPTDNLSKVAKAGGKWPFDVKIIDEDFKQVLITMILDPFDDVRQMTASLLQTYINAIEDTQKQHEALLSALHVAEQKMLASGRADQADSVAYIYALLYSSSRTDTALDLFLSLVVKAERMLDTAKTDLATAVERYPLHGILTSLRYLLDKPAPREIVQEDIYNRLAAILHTIWQVASPILCDDAPEGFLPDEISPRAAVSSKAVLSYCWRALKEASSLTDSILLKLSSQNSHEWTAKYKNDLIGLTFTQLAELRHRGAFSTVAQTWNRCCAVTGDVNMLQILLQRVITLIQKATINTRRSAGMPSLLCGVLIAGPEELLEQAFTQLDTISRQEVQQGLDDESSLPQVHAMNCLKDVLKSTKLADRSECFVPIALQLAADSLRSKAWAIRNCGLMLFRAVIDRLLGTNDSYEEDTKVKNVMDFRQRRSLLDQVLSLLPTERHDVVLEGVFPALQLLQHSILPVDRKVEVKLVITALLGNRSWHIRDKAARTLVTLVPRQTLLPESIARLTEYKSIIDSHNMLHGVLLCLKHLVRAGGHPVGDVFAEDDLTEAALLTAYFAEQTTCSVIQEAAQSVHRQIRGLVYETRSASASVSRSDVSDMMAAQALRVSSNADMTDQWLLKRGYWLNRQSEATSKALLDQWEDYIAACVSAMSDESVFSCVELASYLCSLDAGLRWLWQSIRGKQILLKICLLIYDLLNDDDEEVRLKASQVASSVLSLAEKDAMSGRLEPIVAGHKLLTFMVVKYAGSQEFSQECRHRAFQLDSSSEERLAQLLGEVGSQDTDLFAEEKQNLYLDEVLEAKAWSQAARKTTSFVRKDADDLVRWTNTALDAMITKAQTSKPGAFGWSTTEAVFPFGLRVIYAVEFLLHHVTSSGDKLSIPPSQLREKLLRFELAADAASLHPLWRSELQRVSKIAAVSQFSAIQSLLNGVVGELSSATTL